MIQNSFKSKLLLFGIFIISIGVNAQTECTSYHRKNCINKELAPMRYDSQSKSAIMGKGQVSEFHLVAYNGLDYRITLCNEEILGSQIQFRIFEKVKTLIKDEMDSQESEPASESDYSDESNDEDSYSEDSYSDDSYSDDSYSDDSYSDDSYSDDSYSNRAQGSAVNAGPKFRLTKELLYDNASDNFSNILEFTAEGSKSLIIEITVPGETDGKGKLKIRQMGCVGVLIEHVKSKRSGF